MRSVRADGRRATARECYLNRIEYHFLPISEFVVKNADYLDWDAFAFALARHITDRNGAHRDQRLI
jgi:hypothetical protein